MHARNPLDSYEQLKRQNRRRLVGAVVMVAVAGGLLFAVSGKDNTSPAAQQRVLDSSGAPVAGLPESEAASAPLDAGVVLEPAPGADEDPQRAPAPSAADTAPAPSGGKVVVNTEVKPPLPQRPPEAPPKTPAPPEVKSATKPESKAAPKAETSPEAKPEARPAAKAATKPEAKPAPKPETQAPAPTVVFKPKERDSGGKTAAKEPPKPKTATGGARKPVNPKLTPQEILDNKAAAQVGGKEKAATKPDPQAILDGKSGKSLVQVGAYTNEQQARVVQQKLAAVGVDTAISPSETSKGTVYRVRTGSYDSRAQAEQVLQKIQAQGLGGIVVSR